MKFLEYNEVTIVEINRKKKVIAIPSSSYISELSVFQLYPGEEADKETEEETVRDLLRRYAYPPAIYATPDWLSFNESVLWVAKSWKGKHLNRYLQPVNGKYTPWVVSNLAEILEIFLLEEKE